MSAFASRAGFEDGRHLNLFRSCGHFRQLRDGRFEGAGDVLLQAVVEHDRNAQTDLRNRRADAFPDGIRGGAELKRGVVGGGEERFRAVDRVVVFHKGRVVETGTHEELMRADGHYREIAAAQLKGSDGEDEENPSHIKRMRDERLVEQSAAAAASAAVREEPEGV